MKKIALFLALVVLPGVAGAELTASEAIDCVGMKRLAETATLQKQKGVSQELLYSRLANGKGGTANEKMLALAYLAVDMVFDGYSPLEVRAACVDALKD